MMIWVAVGRLELFDINYDGVLRFLFEAWRRYLRFLRAQRVVVTLGLISVCGCVVGRYVCVVAGCGGHD